MNSLQGKQGIVCTRISFSTLFLYSLFSLIQTVHACEPVVAEVVSSEGVVEVLRQGSDTWDRLQAGEKLCANDIVRSAENSRSALFLQNDTLLRLDQQTTITFTGMGQKDKDWLDLKQGIAHFISRVRQSFEVITPFVNAAVEGTEFMVSASSGSAEISVFEGRVRVRNDSGSLQLKNGQSAYIRQGEKPEYSVALRLDERVQWALYYPWIVDQPQVLSGLEDNTLQSAFSKAVSYLDDNRTPQALHELRVLSDEHITTEIPVFYAQLLLSFGSVSQASEVLKSVIANNPDRVDALSLQVIISVAKNRHDDALSLSRRAVELEPGNELAGLARSYALQAAFHLDEAIAVLAAEPMLSSNNPYVFSRLAELYAATGNLEFAKVMANKAVSANPQSAHAHSVLGFIQLQDIDIEQAEVSFQRAMSIDSSFPLARFGNGLTLIRLGQLSKGRREIEIATSLDPNNALIRSYLGKAYYEESRISLAETQFDLAKQLDFQDPTAWFYNALLMQSQNQPISALAELERSKALNDNRAVYRSRQLLDQDSAVRSASQARIFTDLGFNDLALNEGWNALQIDPSNHSAHRFLSDAYANLPRHGIARTAELLQSQIWQPLSLTPLQPQILENDLGFIENAGPSFSTFNEFTPVFARNDVAFYIDGLLAGDETMAEDIIVAGLHNKFSYSLGQFHYESEGYRLNNDQERDLYNLFFQFQPSSRTSLQLEYRDYEHDLGDLSLLFDRNDFDQNLREVQERETLRFGARHSLSNQSHFAVSLISLDLEERDFSKPQANTDLESTLVEDGLSSEIQYIHTSTSNTYISGLGYLDLESSSRSTVTLDLGILGKIPTNFGPNDDVNIQKNIYSYAYMNPMDSLGFVLGISYDDYRGLTADKSQVNPKFGVIWNPSANTTLRLAAYRTLKRNFITDQTLEPTQIAGFNQFYDDPNATDAKNFGISLDHQHDGSHYSGARLLVRDQAVPIRNVTTNSVEDLDWNERYFTLYHNWVLAQHSAVSVSFENEVLERDILFPRDHIVDLDTKKIPLSYTYFTGPSVNVSSTLNYIHQRGTYFDTVNDTQPSSAKDDFWTMDVRLDYRLPARRGKLSLGVNNLFDSSHHFQETNGDNITVYPERFVFGKFQLAF